jgi:CheY-specific phosphatase CheX
VSTLTTDQLNEIALTALERSAFVFAEPAASDARMPRPTTFARIRVSGSVRGELHLGASEGFLRELAASLLGVEPEEVDPAAHGSDALKEMANMIAGSVVIRYDGENRAYTLGLPEVSSGEAFHAAGARGMAAAVATNGEPLCIIWIEETTARAAA